MRLTTQQRREVQAYARALRSTTARYVGGYMTRATWRTHVSRLLIAIADRQLTDAVRRRLRSSVGAVRTELTVWQALGAILALWALYAIGLLVAQLR